VVVVRPVSKFSVVAFMLGPGLAWAGPLDESAEFEGGSEATSIGLGWLFEGANRVDVEGEALLGGDITVLRTTVAYEQRRGEITLGATFGYTDIDIDYSPRTVTFPADRRESNRQAQIDLSWKATPAIELTGLVRGYEGFPDYRSVWIAEYYEQLFGFVPGYRDADPAGWALGAGAAWDLVPGTTRINFNLGYGEDEIVEGWSFGIGGLTSGRQRLETTSGGATWLQVIRGWLKMETSIRFQEITDRESRFQGQTNLAAALGPDWTLRVNAGATRERPSFEAHFVGVMVDYEFLPGWHVAVNSRYYEDSGEIESYGFSTAAPGLQAYELGASILYDKDDFAVRLYGGFYNTDFEPLTSTNNFFGNLYRDRDWWVTRIAVSYSF
jgi:hypothetical protein